MFNDVTQRNRVELGPMIQPVGKHWADFEPSFLCLLTGHGIRLDSKCAPACPPCRLNEGTIPTADIEQAQWLATRIGQVAISRIDRPSQRWKEQRGDPSKPRRRRQLGAVPPISIVISQLGSKLRQSRNSWRIDAFVMGVIACVGQADRRLVRPRIKIGAAAIAALPHQPSSGRGEKDCVEQTFVKKDLVGGFA